MGVQLCIRNNECATRDLRPAYRRWGQNDDKVQDRHRRLAVCRSSDHGQSEPPVQFETIALLLFHRNRKIWWRLALLHIFENLH